MLTQTSPLQWRVEFRSSRTPIKAVDFKADIEDLSEWPIVTVDCGKLLACWERDSYIVGPVGHWGAEKRTGIEGFLDARGGAINVPRVGIDMRSPRRRWWQLRETPPAPVVSFINGRHRTRYLIDAGAEHMPIQVHANQVALLREFCA